MPSGAATPPNDFTEAVMVQFREKMTERELSVTALDCMTGIDRSSLSKILRCKVQPLFSQVRAIVIALQISVCRS